MNTGARSPSVLFVVVGAVDLPLDFEIALRPALLFLPCAFTCTLGFHKTLPKMCLQTLLGSIWVPTMKSLHCSQQSTHEKTPLLSTTECNDHLRTFFLCEVNGDIERNALSAEAQDHWNCRKLCVFTTIAWLSLILMLPAVPMAQRMAGRPLAESQVSFHAI